jgi:hypothetical protein
MRLLFHTRSRKTSLPEKIFLRARDSLFERLLCRRRSSLELKHLLCCSYGKGYFTEEENLTTLYSLYRQQSRGSRALAPEGGFLPLLVIVRIVLDQ